MYTAAIEDFGDGFDPVPWTVVLMYNQDGSPGANRQYGHKQETVPTESTSSQDSPPGLPPVSPRSPDSDWQSVESRSNDPADSAVEEARSVPPVTVLQIPSRATETPIVADPNQPMNFLRRIGRQVSSAIQGIQGRMRSEPVVQPPLVGAPVALPALQSQPMMMLPPYPTAEAQQQQMVQYQQQAMQYPFQPVVYLSLIHISEPTRPY